MISFQNITLQRGQKILFQSANLTFYAHQKIGLTGRNGCGKSSLFALILGELQPEIGTFSMPSSRISHVLQEILDTAQKAIEYVIDGDIELRAIEKSLEKAQKDHDGERIAHLHLQLEDIDGYTVRSRAAALLNGLGFSNQQMIQKVNDLSGGFRMRLNLARALICRSDVLLLDEPTNHLDLAATVWLERFLQSYRGMLLLISHDREFLDHTVTYIAHIEHKTIKLYTGNYSSFEEQRAEALSLQQKLYEKQQKQRAHWQSYIDRFRYKATKAKQAQSRIKALERMEVIDAANIDTPFEFEFLEPDATPDVLLNLEKVSFGYNNNLVLENINLQIENNRRVGLLGLNGAGKSTLIKLLMGDLQPTSGLRNAHRNLQIGYFSQYQLDQLDPEKSPLSHLQKIDQKTTEQQFRNFLGRFGFSGEVALTKVAPFSGGEKARLVLAMIVWQRPNLLLLDEPTNHLDMDMRNALIKALQDYQGTMMIVSHDRYLLNATTDQLYLITQKHVEDYKGSLNDYVQWLSQNKPDVIHKTRVKSDKKVKEPMNDQEKISQQKRQMIERKLDILYGKVKAIEAFLSMSNIYEAENKKRLQNFLIEQAEIDQKIQKLEKAWDSLNEKS
jgi:ATP-binding cassette subfamily F protein 3